MKSPGPRIVRDTEGKGILGCIFMTVLIGVAIFLAIKLGPIYYSNYNLDSEIKDEVSRAGAHLYDDDRVAADIMAMAKRNDIRLKREDIQVQRFAGQIHIKVDYFVPVDFLVLQHDMSFSIKASSFIGAL